MNKEIQKAMMESKLAIAPSKQAIRYADNSKNSWIIDKIIAGEFKSGPLDINPSDISAKVLTVDIEVKNGEYTRMNIRLYATMVFCEGKDEIIDMAQLLFKYHHHQPTFFLDERGIYRPAFYNEYDKLIAVLMDVAFSE